MGWEKDRGRALEMVQAMVQAMALEMVLEKVQAKVQAMAVTYRRMG